MGDMTTRRYSHRFTYVLCDFKLSIPFTLKPPTKRVKTEGSVKKGKYINETRYTYLRAYTTQSCVVYIFIYTVCLLIEEPIVSETSVQKEQLDATSEDEGTCIILLDM